MNPVPLTLSQFFSLKDKELSPDRLSAIESGEQVSARERIGFKTD